MIDRELNEGELATPPQRGVMQSRVERALRDGELSIDIDEKPSSNPYAPPEPLYYQMLNFPMRNFIIKKVKAPIMKAITTLADRIPAPTRQNCFHPNTLAWFDVLEKFLSMENNPGREPLFKAITKIFLAECEHDIYYRDRINVVLELWLDEVLKGNYKPRSLDHPSECWNADPNIRGEGFKLIQYCYSRKRHNQPVETEKIKEIIDNG